MRKRTRRLCAVILLLICVMSTVCNAKTRKPPKLPKGVYAHMAMVTEVKKPRKGKKNLIIAVDGAGRTWSWYNTSEYWVEGDFAAFNLYNNGTKNYIYDDIIIGEPMYVGFKELF